MGFPDVTRWVLMARDCPRCGLTNPTAAQRCDCGYDFTAHQVLPSYLTNKQLVQIAKEAEAEKIVPVAAGLWFFQPFFFLVLGVVEVVGGL